MPIYLDRHDVPGITAKAAAEVHLKDVAIQDKYGCSCMTYWLEEERGYAFCLIEAPDMLAVRGMHNESHGNLPSQIIEVDREIVKAFLGRIHDPMPLEVAGPGELSVFNDPAFRCIMVADLKDKALLQHRYGSRIGNALLKSFNECLHGTAEKYKGHVVEHHDEFLVSFVSVTSAVDCAVEASESVMQNFESAGLPQVEVQVGLSAGIPVTDNNKIFGDSVKTGKRLKFIAKSCRIYAASSIRELYKGTRHRLFSRTGLIRVLKPEEELFFNRLLDEIQDSITNLNFSQERLSRRIGMSKSQLYRKTMDLTGLSPSDLVQEVRMDRALSMLHRQNRNITETSYELGFTNPSYFTKCFKKRYDSLPGEFMRSYA